jgi:hypothetical protein
MKRHNSGGIEALLRDKTRKPGKAAISEDEKNRICKAACVEKPGYATHWSAREFAKQYGVSHNAASLILRERGIKPHLVKKFVFSTDPRFEEKLADVVGLYMNPPDNAIILCVDEKSQIQARERTAPLLPMLPHVPERRTVDYKRHGMATLFATHFMPTHSSWHNMIERWFAEITTKRIVGEAGNQLLN